MSRPLRLEYEGAFYHITARGNERKIIFQEEDDYLIFSEILSKVKERYGVKIYSYVFMPNHYHLLLETPGGNLVKTMHDIQTAYTQKYNHRYKRIGHLFQGRYKSILVDKDNYLLELSRYIHLNPVRAGIVGDPGAYRWSSYRKYVGKKVNEWIDDRWILKYFGEKRERETRKKYETYVKSGIEEKSNPFKNIWGGFVLGSRDFIKDIIGRMKEQRVTAEIPKETRVSMGHRLEDVEEEVARAYRIEEKELKKKRGNNFFAVKVALYLSRKMTGHSIGEISGYFGGRHYSMVNRAVREIEEKRNCEKKFNRLLEKIEEKIAKSQVQT